VDFGVSYFGERDIRHARRDLDEIAEAGFSAVIHTYPEYDLRYHEEDLGRIVEETRARGLEAVLDPWGVGGLFGGEAYSELALVDLACRQIDARGRSLPACCPNAEATRSLLRRWARSAVAIGADVLFWDEPHFHLGAFREGEPVPACRCEACRSTWARRGGGADLPPEGSADLAAFRTDSLVSLLREAITEVADSGVEHSLCLLPRFEFAAAGSDAWPAFAALEPLHWLGTDPYWMDRPVDPAEYVREHAAPLVSLARTTGRRAEVWIQGIRIPAGREADLESAAAAAAALEPDRLSFWSFRGTERMATLACGDPDAAWAAMLRVVRGGGTGK
jgi:hypothetical protein